MKPEDLLEAIGEVDEDCIEGAQEPIKRKSPGRRWGGLLAAALALALLIPGIHWIRERNRGAAIESENVTKPGSSEVWESVTPEVFPETEESAEELSIYYVEGATLKKDVEPVDRDIRRIFAVWKSKNGIGSEVSLLRACLAGDAALPLPEFLKNLEVEQQSGRGYTLTLQVSKELESVYGGTEGSLLLQSLKLTVTNCLHVEVTQYTVEFR